ncbi:hypothetical protein [Endozoicomonas sp.]|uniref:hypothetical protein n=1 Tax=Endozoicomonas sp. TaxID=1892382 RepID=UPI00288877E1|nr:hypothetical protein [Endozoicomonas sp.]
MVILQALPLRGKYMGHPLLTKHNKSLQNHSYLNRDLMHPQLLVTKHYLTKALTPLLVVFFLTTRVPG